MICRERWTGTCIAGRNCSFVGFAVFYKWDWVHFILLYHMQYRQVAVFSCNQSSACALQYLAAQLWLVWFLQNPQNHYGLLVRDGYGKYCNVSCVLKHCMLWPYESYKNSDIVKINSVSFNPLQIIKIKNHILLGKDVDSVWFDPIQVVRIQILLSM